MLTLVRYAPNIVLLLQMWLAARVARKNRERGARRFLQLAALVGKKWRVAKPFTRQHHLSRMMIHALLLQRATYEQIRPWTDDLSRPAGGMQWAFQSYFADQNYEEALLAATDWCRAVEAKVAQDKTEMKSFFARYGDDLSGRRFIEMVNAEESKANEAPEETCPEANRPTPATLRVIAYLQYYDAHLALEAARWMQEHQLLSPRRAQQIASESQRGEDLGLPQFRVTDDSLRALDLPPSDLAAARRRAMRVL